MRLIQSITLAAVTLGIALPLMSQSRTTTPSGSSTGISNNSSAGISNKNAGISNSNAGISNGNGTSSTTNGNSTSSGNGTATGGGRSEPCWKVAGITPAAMQQRRSIEQNTKSEIASACADSSLSPQQRRQKIQQIRQQTRQQVEALITPQQQEALKACRTSRGEGTAAPKPAGAGKGPCGGEAQEENPAPANNPKPN